MKSTRTAVFALTTLMCLCLLTIACSKEDTLVGEWQSTNPETVQLKITKQQVNPDFYDGFSGTQNGRSYHFFWRIRSENYGTFLDLSPGGFGDMTWSAIHIEVLELSADKLILKWGSLRNFGQGYENNFQFNEPLTSYEFHRVK